jgi:RHS repeat-associated protein
VDDTWYDPAGRVTLRELGASYTLGQTYTYYPWTQQGGRLQSLLSGIAADTDSLQSLSYSYDAGGNVLTINDYKAGGTQTQTFTYDALDRLVSAVASGGTGGTYGLQNYTYNPDTGNLSINGTVSYTYGDSAHKHAVTGTSNGNSYSYDANGNQTSRRVGGITYTLIYDAESRLVQIKRGSTIQATYTYDGGGNRVKTVVGSTTTAFVGNILEWTGSTTTMKRYYYAGGQRVAMRQGSSTLYYLLTDHLGSTAITATSAGGFYTELRYYPWGGTRYASGTTPTSFRYTGQREAEVGLYYYGSRFYDAQLGRFVSPDTIIPNPRHPLSFDRFAYVQNNPIKYTDPTGHWSCGDQYDPACAETIEEEYQYYELTHPLPDGMVIPDELPTQITDLILIEAWIWLYNSATGRPLAEYIRDNNIPVVAVEGYIGRFRPDGTIEVALGDGHIIAIAGNMGHEAYHSMEPFGDARPSLFEEYMAYRITDRVMSELSPYTLTPQGTAFVSGLTFDGFDCYNPQSLVLWFYVNGMLRYIDYLRDGSYTLYPDGWLPPGSPGR